jgi:oligoendopeptidase F
MTDTAAPAQDPEAQKVRWDLTELFASPDDPRIEESLKASLETAQRFEQSYRGRVASLTPPEFVEMMEAIAAYYKQTALSGIYGSLLHALNSSDAAAGRLLARLHEAGAEQGRHLVFFSLELAALTDEQVARLYQDPAVLPYKHTIEQERLYHEHQLTEPEERLLTEFSPVGGSAWTRLFGELCAAMTVDLDGNATPLMAALAKIYDPSREVREQTTHAVTTTLAEDLKTRSYILNVLLQEKAIADRLRDYPTWISARNLANETSDQAVQALVDAVTGRYDIVARYYTQKRRLLGLDELHEWDRYAPLETTTRAVSWQGAKDRVLSSYHRFSPRAGAIVERFFDQPWIDAPVQEGKRGGAFCAGTIPELHPFVMLNFTGQLRDVLTMAHELGHGLHDVLSGEHNNIFDYHPPLTLAETASVFGEQLTFDAILASEGDPKVRLSLLCQQVEDAFATIFRQIAMNRFENAIHTARRSQGELSAEQIGDLWQEQIQAMFGGSLLLTDAHRPWWSYVEHFVHTPGYVYAYAYGNLLALSVYRKYREDRSPEFADRYLSFLALGGSKAPDEAVQAVGMDITDPGFWAAGLQILSGMVDEVERLAGEVSSA